MIEYDTYIEFEHLHEISSRKSRAIGRSIYSLNRKRSFSILFIYGWGRAWALGLETSSPQLLSNTTRALQGQSKASSVDGSFVQTSGVLSVFRFCADFKINQNIKFFGTILNHESAHSVKFTQHRKRIICWKGKNFFYANTNLILYLDFAPTRSFCQNNNSKT